MNNEEEIEDDYCSGMTAINHRSIIDLYERVDKLENEIKLIKEEKQLPEGL